MKEFPAILDRIARLEPARRAVLATLVTVEGSSYRRPGARLLWIEGGERLGSISGGCLEEDVSARASAVAASGRPETALYDTTFENDLVWGVGLGCQGVVRVVLERLEPRPAWASALAANLAARRPTELAVIWAGPDGTPGTRLAKEVPPLPPSAGVFREIVVPPPSLTIFGAGDDARPLVRAAKELGWRVAVADSRPAFATSERFPEADDRIVAPAAELAERAAPEPGSLAVVMTHRYADDAPILAALLPRPLAYLGLLGPRSRADRILNEMAGQGRAPAAEQRARLRAPVGLDLGAETPEEIALSILAEMRAALAGRDGRPLRERSGPIHG